MVSCGSLLPRPPRSLSKNGLKTRRWWSGHCFLSAVDERGACRSETDSLFLDKRKLKQWVESGRCASCLAPWRSGDRGTVTPWARDPWEVGTASSPFFLVATCTCHVQGRGVFRCQAVGDRGATGLTAAQARQPLQGRHGSVNPSQPQSVWTMRMDGRRDEASLPVPASSLAGFSVSVFAEEKDPCGRWEKERKKGKRCCRTTVTTDNNTTTDGRQPDDHPPCTSSALRRCRDEVPGKMRRYSFLRMQAFRVCPLRARRTMDVL